MLGWFNGDCGSWIYDFGLYCSGFTILKSQTPIAIFRAWEFMLNCGAMSLKNESPPFKETEGGTFSCKQMDILSPEGAQSNSDGRSPSLQVQQYTSRAAAKSSAPELPYSQFKHRVFFICDPSGVTTLCLILCYKCVTATRSILTLLLMPNS